MAFEKKNSVVIVGDANGMIRAVVVNGVPVLEFYAGNAPSDAVNGAILENYAAGPDQLSLQLFSGALNSGGGVDSKLYLIAANGSDGSQVYVEATERFRVGSALPADSFTVDTTTGNGTIDNDWSVGNDLTTIGDAFIGGALDVGSTVDVATKEHGYGQCTVNDLSPALNAGSTTFAAITNVSTGTYVKQRTNTRTRARFSGCGFAAVALTAYEFALNFNDGGAINTTVLLTKFFFNEANSHRAYPEGEDVISAATLPAGTYTVTAMYRRSGAVAGNLNMNADDVCSFSCIEMPEA